MTGDEMERTIQFILQQQAQFAAQQARFSEWQAEISARQSQTQIQIGTLTDAMLTITGVVGKLAEAQTSLTKAQARTEERLNAFIVFVERYISERRNGKK